MKIDKELEMDFIRFIQKKSFDRTSFEENRINKRNHLIESQFVWTQEVNNKLTVLNEKLREEEKRIFSVHKQLEKQCKLMVKNKTIDYFNIDIELSLWNKNHYKKYEPSVYGNPFFECKFIDFMNWQKEKEYDSSPINRYDEVEYCRTFYCLVFHTHDLTWFDLYNTDEVWMEIKVDYQFTFKVISKLKKINSNLSTIK